MFVVNEPSTGITSLTCGAEGMIGSCMTVLCLVPTNSDKGTAADVAGFV